MMNLRHILVFAAVALLCSFQCSGGSEELDVVLEANVASIAADGKAQVKFTVFEGNADVTSQAVIKDVETGQPLLGNIFSTTAAGEYFFFAEYNGRKTNSVKVVAQQVVVSQFVRNVCLMEFTDATCSFCPDASIFIAMNVLSMMDHVHLMAFHEKDEWKSDQFATLFSKFSLEGTPATAVDMRKGYSMEQGKREAVLDAIAESASDYPAHCGVAVSSSVNEQLDATINVNVFSEKTTDYYLAVYIVEDGIRGPQLDGSIIMQDYYHEFVVRKMLSATVYGDGLGRLEAQQEKSKEYSLRCSQDWNMAKTYVYALALDSDGYVNNMQVCLLDGGSTDYEYIN